jgi:hypothetical protein
MINGFKLRKGSTYNKNKIFRISRSRFSAFYLRCKLCFYLENKYGLKPIPVMPYTLNNAVDHNLKLSFDICREQKIPHKIMIDEGLKNIIPYQHKDLEKWREPLRQGIQYLNSKNFLLTGGIDDLWIDLTTNELIIVDYKAQAKRIEDLKPENYWSIPSHEDYKVQLSFYRYLFEKNGFPVKQKAYIVHANANKNIPFENSLGFYTSLIPYETNVKFIEPTLTAIKDCLDSDLFPEPHENCHQCVNYLARKEILKEIPFKINKRSFFVAIKETLKILVSKIINFIQNIGRKLLK